jgi:hypothetical protein
MEIAHEIHASDKSSFGDFAEMVLVMGTTSTSSDSKEDTVLDIKMEMRILYLVERLVDLHPRRRTVQAR